MPELLPLLVRVGLVVMLLVGGALFAFSAFIMAALARSPTTSSTCRSTSRTTSEPRS